MAKRRKKVRKSRAIIRESSPTRPAMDEFEVRHSVETLIKAEEIKKDKRMMRAVGKEIAKKEKALKLIKR